MWRNSRYRLSREQQMKKEKAIKIIGRTRAIKEGRIGSKVRYPKRIQKALEQLARDYN
jgi:hypothetical protein